MAKTISWSAPKVRQDKLSMSCVETLAIFHHASFSIMLDAVFKEKKVQIDELQKIGALDANGVEKLSNFCGEHSKIFQVFLKTLTEYKLSLPLPGPPPSASTSASASTSTPQPQDPKPLIAMKDWVFETLRFQTYICNFQTQFDATVKLMRK